MPLEAPTFCLLSSTLSDTKNNNMALTANGKGKVHPRTGYESTEGE